MIGSDLFGENPCLVNRNRKKLLNRQALSLGWLVCSVGVYAEIGIDRVSIT